MTKDRILTMQTRSELKRTLVVFLLLIFEEFFGISLQNKHAAPRISSHELKHAILKEGYLNPLPDLRPYFVPEAKETIDFADGASEVSLHCKVKNQGQFEIAWIRHKDAQLLSINDQLFFDDSRFSIHHRQSSYVLSIRNPIKPDAGLYECQLSTEPLQRFLITLRFSDNPYPGGPNTNPYEFAQLLSALQEPRDIQADEPAGNSDLLRISGPALASLGSEVHLFCEVPLGHKIRLGHEDPAKVKVTWLFNRMEILPGLEVFLNAKYRLHKAQFNNSTNMLTSSLSIRQFERSDVGAYACRSSTGAKDTLIVNVLEDSASHSHSISKKTSSSGSRTLKIANKLAEIVASIALAVILNVPFANL